jgi:hypothetical protein
MDFIACLVSQVTTHSMYNHTSLPMATLERLISSFSQPSALICRYGRAQFRNLYWNATWCLVSLILFIDAIMWNKNLIDHVPVWCAIGILITSICLLYPITHLSGLLLYSRDHGDIGCDCCDFSHPWCSTFQWWLVCARSQFCLIAIMTSHRCRIVSPPLAILKILDGPRKDLYNLYNKMGWLAWHEVP